MVRPETYPGVLGRPLSDVWTLWTHSSSCKILGLYQDRGRSKGGTTSVVVRDLVSPDSIRKV